MTYKQLLAQLANIPLKALEDTAVLYDEKTGRKYEALSIEEVPENQGDGYLIAVKDISYVDLY